MIAMSLVCFLTLEHLNRSHSLSGGALRVGGLRYLFSRLGYDSVVLRPKSAIAASEGERLFEGEDFHSELKGINPDLLIVEQWALLDSLPPMNCPVICDLHGSLYWENWYKSYRDSRQLLAKVHCLQKADYFFVPGLRQYYYFLGWGMMAGLPCDEDRILKVPLVLDPQWYGDESPERKSSLVAGGGKWPWVYTDVEKDLSAYFKKQGFALESYYYEPGVSRAGETGAGSHASSEQGQSHGSIVSTYMKSGGALDLYWMNRERSLAITTRTVEYLYCGLPVIYAEGLELSDLIRSQGLGVVVKDWRELLKISNLNEVLNQSREKVSQWKERKEWEEEALGLLSSLQGSLSKRRQTSFSIGSVETENRQLKKDLTTAKTSLVLVEHQNEFLKEERAYYRDLWVRDTREGYYSMMEMMGFPADKLRGRGTGNEES